MASIEKKLRGYICDEREKNWAREYSHREMSKHKTASVIDHPNESVTAAKIADGAISLEKLDDDVIGCFSAIEDEAEAISSSVQAERIARTAADAQKADKADTLSGYGIEDAYTKQEVQSEVNSKAEETLADAKVYTDSEIAEVNNQISEVNDELTTLNSEISSVNDDISEMNGKKLTYTRIYESELDGCLNAGLYEVIGIEQGVFYLGSFDKYFVIVYNSSLENLYQIRLKDNISLRNRTQSGLDEPVWTSWVSLASTADFESSILTSKTYTDSKNRIAEWQAWSKEWDALQQNGTRTDYSGLQGNGFFGTEYTDETFKPKYDICPLNARYMFVNCPITDLKSKLSEYSVMLDFSGITSANDIYYTFYHSLFTHIGLIDLSNVAGTLPGTFRAMYGRNIVIDELRLSPNILWNTASQSPFFSSPGIISMNITGTIGKTNFDVRSQVSLDAASIESIIKALSKTTSDMCIYLSATAINSAYGSAAEFETRIEELVTAGEYEENWTINIADN